MRLILVLMVCFSLDQTCFAIQSDSYRLPASARVLLNRRFPGWRFSDVSPQVQQYVKEYLDGASPVVVRGDFDGDGRRDYAALIRRGRVVNADERAFGAGNLLVIFLKRTKGYRMHVVKEPGGEYIMLATKGTGGYNYHTDKRIKYANDAIVAIIFEKGGQSYVYWKGRFVSFVSID